MSPSRYAANALSLLTIAILICISQTTAALYYDCPSDLTVSGFPSSLSFLNRDFSPLNNYDATKTLDPSGQINERTHFVAYANVGTASQTTYHMYYATGVANGDSGNWVVDDDTDPTSFFAILRQINDVSTEPNPASMFSWQWYVATGTSVVAPASSFSSAFASNFLELQCKCFGFTALVTTGLNSAQVDGKDVYLSQGTNRNGHAVYQGVNNQVYLYYASSSLLSGASGWHFDSDTDFNPETGVIAATSKSLLSSSWVYLDRNGRYGTTSSWIVECAGCQKDIVISGITGTKSTWNGVYTLNANAYNQLPAYTGKDSSDSSAVYLTWNPGQFTPAGSTWGLSPQFGAATNQFTLNEAQNWLMVPPSFAAAKIMWQYNANPGVQVPMQVSCIGGPAPPAPVQSTPSSSSTAGVVSSTAPSAVSSSSTAGAVSSSSSSASVSSSTGASSTAQPVSSTSSAASSTAPAAISSSSSSSTGPLSSSQSSSSSSSSPSSTGVSSTASIASSSTGSSSGSIAATSSSTGTASSSSGVSSTTSAVGSSSSSTASSSASSSSTGVETASASTGSATTGSSTGGAGAGGSSSTGDQFHSGSTVIVGSSSGAGVDILNAASATSYSLCSIVFAVLASMLLMQLQI